MYELCSSGYLVLIWLLTCFSAYRYHILTLYYRVKSQRPVPAGLPADWPTVAIQIPIFNERYVVERAIQSACEVDYPANRLEIQLLDDSTDDTSELIARTIEPYRRQGLRIVHVRREERGGFKAGALAYGLERTTSELVAVFDVDFVIPRDFLTRTVPFFTDGQIGMVQARWGHVNGGCSLLTKAQAMLLDGHFAIEQVARHRSGRFFNFNGTAGIWRTRAIVQSGGWQADTLSEDLDLSYRAQLAGWRCVYLPDLVAPAELPVEMNALKTQQFRWAKGSMQAAKKLLPRIFRSRLPWSVKSEAFFHLTGYLSFPIGLTVSLGLPLILMGVIKVAKQWYVDATWGLLLTVPGIIFYLCAQRELYADWRKRLAIIPFVVAIGIGLSVNNTFAVLDGLFGRQSTFLRTPKFGVESRMDRWLDKGYQTQLTGSVWLELALAAYFGLGCVAAIERGLWLILPSAFLFFLGFAYVGGLSCWQHLQRQEWVLRLSASSSQAPEFQT